MSSWNSIDEDIKRRNRPDAYDVVRREKMDVVQQITGRHLIVYATDFTTQNPLKAQLISNLVVITLPDKDGFDEVTRNLPRGSELDVLLHSPGGSAEATESIVELLRDRFSNIRFIIPNVAKSAATMMAMSGEQLLMDERSELGPTDPQMIFQQNGRVIIAPAQAIKDQFKTAQEDVNADPNKLPSWVPILGWYGPSLLAECDNLLTLSRKLVSKWLASYMFSGDPEASEKAEHIAEYLANHNNFHSHGRRVGMTDLRSQGVNIVDMRTVPELQNAIRDLYTTIMLTFANTGAYKIFENNQKEALIWSLQVSPEQQQPQSQQTPLPRNRQEERRQPPKKKRR